jgi:hypothetical protein
MKLREKIALTTFGLFMVEAIMHYNLGKDDCKCEEQKKIKKGFMPPTKSLIQLAIIVGIFSVVNGVLIDKLEK